MEYALERVIALSDGIFAVAITLLVLSISVPDLGNSQTDANLQDHLLGAIPSIIGFVISFAVVGIFWLSHHRLFQVVREYDRPTLYANLLFLMTPQGTTQNGPLLRPARRRDVDHLPDLDAGRPD